MSDKIAELADALARDTIIAAEKLGDDELVNEIATVIGSSSPSTEEAFRTAARVRLAEARARQYLEKKLAGEQVAKPVDVSGDAEGTNIGGDH
ncbi:MAG: hypothetical protein AAGF88_13185 [Pseudomonadota bacterium]